MIKIYCEVNILNGTYWCSKSNTHGGELGPSDLTLRAFLVSLCSRVFPVAVLKKANLGLLHNQCLFTLVKDDTANLAGSRITEEINSVSVGGTINAGVPSLNEIGERELNTSLHPSSLSASWLGMQCDQPPWVPAAKLCPPWRTDCILKLWAERNSSFPKLFLLGSLQNSEDSNLRHQNFSLSYTSQLWPESETLSFTSKENL